MQIEVRDIKDSDFVTLSEIHNNHNEPDHHKTPQEMQHSHETRLARMQYYKRVVADLEDEVVATAMRYSREGDKRGHYWIDLSVHQDYRLSGIEKHMVDALLEGLADGRPTHFWNCIRSDFNRTVEFLESYGFKEEFRSWGSHLDLTKFDFERFKPEIARLESEGFRFSSYAALDDIDKEAKLIKFQRGIEEDTSYYEPIIPKVRDDISSEDIPNEGCFIALDGDRIVGMAGLEHTGEGGFLQNSVTGVNSDYRNRGIATVLKALVADYAKSIGKVDINAAGSGKNSPMLKVNVKLGYDIEPAWITYCADLRRLA